MYRLVYDPITGKAIVAKVVGTASICIYPGSTDYQDFLIWDSKQVVPLYLNSTIPVIPPEPLRDLAKELDELKKEVEAITAKIG